jgi:hypothetical protein
MPLRALFLDIDGVLHPSTAINGIDFANPAMQTADALRGAGLLCHVQALLDAIADSDVLIIVHSSWRDTPWAGGVLREVLGRCFAGFTIADLAREASIADTCERFEIADFLIVDDAHGEFETDHIRCRLLVTNPLTGLDTEILARVRAWARKGITKRS